MCLCASVREESFLQPLQKCDDGVVPVEWHCHIWTQEGVMQVEKEDLLFIISAFYEPIAAGVCVESKRLVSVSLLLFQFSVLIKNQTVLHTGGHLFSEFILH